VPDGLVGADGDPAPKRVTLEPHRGVLYVDPTAQP